MSVRLAAAALLAASPALALAAPAPANRDVKCLMLSNLYAKAAAHPEGQKAAAQARLFYLGRVSGRLSGAPLTTAMSAAAKTVTPASAGTEMNACLATVQSSAASVEAAGKTVRQMILPDVAPTVSGPAVGPANR